MKILSIIINATFQIILRDINITLYYLSETAMPADVISYFFYRYNIIYVYNIYSRVITFDVFVIMYIYLREFI